ncbi:hypothetical protein ACOSQ3_015150 [Xanthoceras sorbifolium]
MEKQVFFLVGSPGFGKCLSLFSVPALGNARKFAGKVFYVDFDTNNPRYVSIWMNNLMWLNNTWIQPPLRASQLLQFSSNLTLSIHSNDTPYDVLCHNISGLAAT